MTTRPSIHLHLPPETRRWVPAVEARPDPFDNRSVSYHTPDSSPKDYGCVIFALGNRKTGLARRSWLKHWACKREGVPARHALPTLRFAPL